MGAAYPMACIPPVPDVITGEIYRVTSDGSDLQLILESEGPDEIFHSPRISPDGTRIVYVTTRHKLSREEGNETTHNRRNFEIETALLDGTDRRRLTEHYMQDTSPMWSPDGSKIAFMRINPGGWPPGNAGIYTMAADGSDQEVVLPREPIDFDVFPNIRFGGYWDKTAETFVLQPRVPNREMIASDEPTDSNAAAEDLVLATDLFYGGGPVWSPDGDKIAFIGGIEYVQKIRISDYLDEVSRASTPRALYTVNADGSDLTPVLTPPPYGDDDYGINIDSPGWPLVWSPDGKKIAFLGYFHPQSHERQSETRQVDWLPGLGLYDIGIDGSGLREIAIIDESERKTGELSWSPDGSLLLLTTISHHIAGSRWSQSQIHIVRVDGSVPRVDALGLDASWSPDGSRIAVIDSSSPDEYPLYSIDKLYTMATDGTDIQVIVERDEDGELRAVNQVEKNCFLLLFCG